MNKEDSGGHYAPRTRLVDKIFAGDKALWVVIILLLIYSIFVVYSTTSYNPQFNASQELTRQILYICIGLAGLFVAQSIPVQFYRRIIRPLYWFALILTAVMIITHRGAGAARSLNIFGIESQPFEMLKIMVVLMLADRLARLQKRIDTIDLIPSLDIRAWIRDAKTQRTTFTTYTIPVLGPVILACCLTLRTSNSTTFIIAASCFIMLFLGRAKKSDLTKLIVLGVVVGGAALLAFGGRKDTMGGRFANYNPNLITKSAVEGSDGLEYYKQTREADQAMYAKMSVASGRVLGKGPGRSTNRYLQEADKDMAYAFLIEEYGFVFGGVIILMAFLILFYRTIVIFNKCGTAFPALTVLGLGMMILLQAMMHMLVSVSLIPITGQQLPIVSKGGSSLVFILTSLGLILGISAQTERNTLEKPKDETMLENNK